VKGARGRRSRTIRRAHEVWIRAEAFSYRGRKERKRDFRALWIQRINAAARRGGLTYARFMHGLKRAGILLDRKQLAAVASDDPVLFEVLLGKVKSA
jgi:large subunit ribosomal protein L20